MITLNIVGYVMSQDASTVLGSQDQEVGHFLRRTLMNWATSQTSSWYPASLFYEDLTKELQEQIDVAYGPIFTVFIRTEDGDELPEHGDNIELCLDVAPGTYVPSKTIH